MDSSLTLSPSRLAMPHQGLPFPHPPHTPAPPHPTATLAYLPQAHLPHISSHLSPLTYNALYLPFPSPMHFYPYLPYLPFPLPFPMQNLFIYIWYLGILHGNIDFPLQPTAHRNIGMGGWRTEWSGGEQNRWRNRSGLTQTDLGNVPMPINISLPLPNCLI